MTLMAVHDSRATVAATTRTVPPLARTALSPSLPRVVLFSTVESNRDGGDTNCDGLAVMEPLAARRDGFQRMTSLLSDASQRRQLIGGSGFLWRAQINDDGGSSPSRRCSVSTSLSLLFANSGGNDVEDGGELGATMARRWWRGGWTAAAAWVFLSFDHSSPSLLLC